MSFHAASAGPSSANAFRRSAGTLCTVPLGTEAYGSTGWELLILPASLMLGQVVVASGLISAVVTRRRGIDAESGKDVRSCDALSSGSGCA
ncbi:hypothetical protein W59_20193 [Rhodococcus opacus RKJ300 = JCM 13270]|uniref:Uncharacterized protein n=1 Tax=Rhodococcus opacus RKJ300 = JCM 13270 TaxID=1165867 RepID=I0WP47_RHOOP|nr:hypothetical protein W59_20193 [Rhodococcus opacus RKJ300 = JCM 13270]